MAFYQPSAELPFSPPLFDTPKESHTFIQQDRAYLLDALNQGRLTLSLSPLLGCDYVFIKHQTDECLMDYENIQRTLSDILRLLSLTPKQTILITLCDTSDDMPYQFSRYDFVWTNQNAESVTKTDISENEQVDFMEMIYNCSSPI